MPHPHFLCAAQFGMHDDCEILTVILHARATLKFCVLSHVSQISVRWRKNFAAVSMRIEVLQRRTRQAFRVATKNGGEKLGIYEWV